MQSERPSWPAGFALRRAAFLASGRNDSEPWVASAREGNESRGDRLKVVRRLRQIKPFRQNGMRSQYGELLAQCVVLRPLRADEHAAPRLLRGAETEHQAAAEI